MKKIFFALAVLLVSASASYAQSAKPFKKNNKYGIVQGDKTLVKPKYENMQTLESNVYAAKLKGKYGIINQRGDIVTPITYDSIRFFSSNTYLVQKDQKWGLLNRQNAEVLPIKYSEIYSLNNFLSEIKEQNKLGLINMSGEVVLSPKYDEIKTFTPSSFLVKEKGKSGIVDALGKVVVPVEYDDFEKNEDSNSYTLRKGNKKGIVNSQWEVVIPAAYDSIENSIVGKILLLDGKIGFYTASGKLVKPSFNGILFYQPEFGLAVVTNGNKRGFVTSDGVIVEPVYENMSRFSARGISFVEKDGKLMAIDYRGKEMTVQDTMSSSKLPTPSSK